MAASHYIKLAGWPACIDCITWSLDCEIAVACNEIIEILLPKLKLHSLLHQHHESEENNKWLRVRLSVSLFSTVDLPFVNPLPFNIFSIAEEQSASRVVAIAWSRPGLAKYGRCALAVLTSNLVLSIWACDSDPAIGDNWKRALIVNQSLNHKNSTTEQARLQRRIRAFTWSEGFKETAEFDSQANFTSRSDPQDFHLLALSNDAGEIVLCEVSSPHKSQYEGLATWTARQLTFAEATSNQDQLTLSASLLDIGPRARSLVDRITWSPWFETSNSPTTIFKSYIGFTLESELIVWECSLSPHPSIDIRLSNMKEVPSLHGRCMSPLRWVEDSEGKSVSLLFARINAISALTLPTNHTSNSNHIPVLTSHGIEPDCSGFSGIACQIDKDRALCLLTPEQILSTEMSLRFVNLPLEQDAPTSTPLWCEYANELSQAFCDQKNFPGETVTRFWGLCSNPNQDHLAICLSIHPKDIVQYATTSEQESFLLLTREVNPLPKFDSGASAESILFSVLRYVESQSDKISQVKRYRDLAGWAESLLSLNSIDELCKDPFEPLSTHYDAVRWLRRSIEAQIPLIGVLLDHLSRRGIALQMDASGRPPAHFKTLWVICTMILKLSKRFFQPSKIEVFILANYMRSRKFLAKSWPSHFHEFPSDSMQQRLLNVEFDEICEICAEPVPFEHVRWANCVNGHQFLRCGITLTAIQKPMISKACNLCGQQYIKDASLICTEQYSSSSDNPTTFEDTFAESFSLIGVLRATCRACVYCGGKFGITSAMC